MGWSQSAVAEKRSNMCGYDRLPPGVGGGMANMLRMPLS